MNQTEANSVKTPVVVRDDYTMYLEFSYGLLWFHTDVRKWSHKIKVKFTEDLNLLHYLVGHPVVAMVKQSNKKLGKFARLTGFEKKQETILNTGDKADIYMWGK